MQIVIDIPEVFYEALKKTAVMVSGQRSGKTLMSVIYNAVANGTPLPKGHGRLIDEKIAYKKFYSRCLAKVATEVFTETPTIIEADAESEGEEIKDEKL